MHWSPVVLLNSAQATGSDYFHPICDMFFLYKTLVMIDIAGGVRSVLENSGSPIVNKEAGLEEEEDSPKGEGSQTRHASGDGMSMALTPLQLIK
eukprot:m.164597 g.164597  ORF g.164597 m.164597 type:complete len:94 (-) comp14401_c0_seq1:616-897(-)